MQVGSSKSSFRWNPPDIGAGGLAEGFEPAPDDVPGVPEGEPWPAAFDFRTKAAITAPAKPPATMSPMIRYGIPEMLPITSGGGATSCAKLEELNSSGEIPTMPIVLSLLSARYKR